nr:hypothetical protein CFP56_64138 [Quercus suber]
MSPSTGQRGPGSNRRTRSRTCDMQRQCQRHKEDLTISPSNLGLNAYSTGTIALNVSRYGGPKTWNWCATTGPNVTFQDREDMPVLSNSLCQVWTHNTSLILASKMMELPSTKDIVSKRCASDLCAKEAAKVGRHAMAMGMFIGLPVLSAGNRTLNGSRPAQIFNQAVHYTIRSLMSTNSSQIGFRNSSDVGVGNITNLDVGETAISTHRLARRGFRSRTGRFLAKTRSLAHGFSSTIKKALRLNVNAAALEHGADPDPAPPGAKDAEAPTEANSPARIADDGLAREAHLTESARLQEVAGKEGEMASRWVRVSHLEEELGRAYIPRWRRMLMSSADRQAANEKLDRVFRSLQNEKSQLEQRGYFKEGGADRSHKLPINQKGFLNDVPGEDIDVIGRNWQYGVTLSQETRIAPQDVERLGINQHGQIQGKGAAEFFRGRETLLSFDPNNERSAEQFFADHDERIGAKSSRLLDTVSAREVDLELERVSEGKVFEWLEGGHDEIGIKSDRVERWLEDVEGTEDAETAPKLLDEWRNGEIPDLTEPEAFETFDTSMEEYSLANDGIDDIWDAADYDIQGVINGDYDGDFDTDGKAFSDGEVDYGKGQAKGIKGAKGKGRAGKGKGSKGKMGGAMDGVGEEMGAGMGEEVAEGMAKGGASAILRDIVLALGAL